MLKKYAYFVKSLYELKDVAPTWDRFIQMAGRAVENEYRTLLMTACGPHCAIQGRRGEQISTIIKLSDDMKQLELLLPDSDTAVSFCETDIILENIAEFWNDDLAEDADDSLERFVREKVFKFMYLYFGAYTETSFI